MGAKGRATLALILLWCGAAGATPADSSQVILFFFSRLHKLLLQCLVLRKNPLRLIQRLRAHFAHMIYTH